MNNAYNEIDNFIEEFNHAWTQGSPEKIGALLHEDVVFLSPDFKTEIKGKSPCLETIKEYTQTATTHTFEINEKNVNYWPNTVVVKLGYFVVYEINKEIYRENGTELWMLVRNINSWQLVYRALISHDAI